MKMHEIREVIRLVDESTIQEFELEYDGTKVTIKKALSNAGIQVTETPTVRPEQTTHVERQAEGQAPAVQQEEPQSVPTPTASEEKEDDTDLHRIVSPMVGTFYQAPSPDSEPYVKVGDRVDEKSVVCIVEAMKLMNEIEAEVKGEIVEVLVENGQLVEYGQPLFLVKTD